MRLFQHQNTQHFVLDNISWRHLSPLSHDHNLLTQIMRAHQPNQWHNGLCVQLDLLRDVRHPADTPTANWVTIMKRIKKTHFQSELKWNNWISSGYPANVSIWQKTAQKLQAWVIFWGQWFFLWHHQTFKEDLFCIFCCTVTDAHIKMPVKSSETIKSAIE